MKEALFYRKTNDGHVICTLCPRECRLKDGQLGFCNVRLHQQGKLVTLAYAHPSAVHVDPVEKKPLYHVLPGSRILSLGTAGCNLGCRFCQNWTLSKSKVDLNQAYYLTSEEVISITLKNHCQSIAFTYNEPTIFAEYLMDISHLSHEKGLKNVMVTNGYIHPEAIDTVYEHIDAANVDLKGFSGDFYKKLTLAKLEPVLETLVHLKKLGKWIEITNLVIPGWNDDDKMVRSMLEWILNNLGENVPLHFTAFHPDYQLTDVPATNPQTLIRFRNLARQMGVRFVYTGNIAWNEGSITYCPGCNEHLIIREWYHTRISPHFEDGICRKCGTTIPGIWKS